MNRFASILLLAFAIAVVHSLPVILRTYFLRASNFGHLILCFFLDGSGRIE